MHACTLHKLHYSRNEYIHSVTDGIYLHFLALNIFINKYRLILVYLDGGFEIVSHLLFF